MNSFVRNFTNARLQFLLAFAFNIITWLIIRFQIKPSSELIPLHYNVFYGSDYVGKGYFIYVIPVVGLIILALNYILFNQIRYRDEFAAKIFALVGLAVEVFILIAVLFLKSVIVF